MEDTKRLYILLKEKFGLNEFRPGQLEAIKHLLTDKRLLCIQPTGFGKSLLYQLPSLLLPGITIVISPLLALIRDQIDSLNNRFGIPAASINSDQTEEENRSIYESVQKGKIKILFVAPEQLDHINRFEFLLGLPTSLIVVDEAHCISTWGHDFRPSYRQIINFVKALQEKNSDVHVLGLTATANEDTEKDIAKQLEPNKILRASTERSNITLSVFHVTSTEKKLSNTLSLINQLDGGGIIYCATRENTDIVASFLREQGVNAAAYHAGLNPEDKQNLQKAFIEDRYKVCVATNALGMGIDKPNIRFIIHFDFPGSITAYYQEVGRAGRDGKPATGILLYDKADYRIQKYFIDSSQPTREDFDTIIKVIENAEESLNLMTIKRDTGLHPTRVLVVIAECLEQGFLKKEAIKGKQVYSSLKLKNTPNLTRYERQYSVKMRELNHIIGYATQNKTCYMELLRQALGDHKTDPCGTCSICTNQTLHIEDNQKLSGQITTWLTKRVGTIQAKKTHNMSQGIALLDTKLRLPLVVDFFKNRTESESVPEELLTLIKEHIGKLADQDQISAIVSIPSRTWKSRSTVAKYIAHQLNVPNYLNLLSWKENPHARQGELLNNDQRRYNVQNYMTVNEEISFPSGKIILLDDYIGSGATMREAARTLRKMIGKEQDIIPFTIAQVKWKLGSPGMV